MSCCCAASNFWIRLTKLPPLPASTVLTHKKSQYQLEKMKISERVSCEPWPSMDAFFCVVVLGGTQYQVPNTTMMFNIIYHWLKLTCFFICSPNFYKVVKFFFNFNFNWLHFKTFINKQFFPVRFWIFFHSSWSCEQWIHDNCMKVKR